MTFDPHRSGAALSSQARSCLSGDAARRESRLSRPGRSADEFAADFRQLVIYPRADIGAVVENVVHNGRFFFLDRLCGLCAAPLRQASLSRSGRLQFMLVLPNLSFDI